MKADRVIAGSAFDLGEKVEFFWEDVWDNGDISVHERRWIPAVVTDFVNGNDGTLHVRVRTNRGPGAARADGSVSGPGVQVRKLVDVTVTSITAQQNAELDAFFMEET